MARQVILGLFGALGACAAPAPPSALQPTGVEAGRLVFAFEGPSGLEGTLRTVMRGETYLASVRVPTPRASARVSDATQTGDSNAQSGADLFSRFPERWPKKNVLRVREDGTVSATLLGDEGGQLRCTFHLATLDRGFEGRAMGRCVDADEQSYEAEVR